MSPAPPPSVPLQCHASTPCEAVRRLEARVHTTQSGQLQLEYSLDADFGRVRLPEPGPPLRTDGLWRHTCFEAFIAGPDSPDYCELNLSPSSRWAVYRFAAYREGMAPVDGITDLRIAVRHVGETLRLDASLPLHGLPLKREGVLRLALAAVIEEHEGRLSYWALRHPPGRPDFHHRDGFVLELHA